MKHIVLFCLILPIFFGACKKEPEHATSNDPEYFEFGYSGGIAGIKKVFVIKNGEVFPQDSTQPPLSAAKYEAARKLITDFPDYLTTHPDQSFLCQGCADMVTTGIRTRTNGVEHYWYMDMDQPQIPAEVRAYFSEVSQVTDGL